MASLAVSLVGLLPESLAALASPHVRAVLDAVVGTFTEAFEWAPESRCWRHSYILTNASARRVSTWRSWLRAPVDRAGAGRSGGPMAVARPCPPLGVPAGNGLVHPGRAPVPPRPRLVAESCQLAPRPPSPSRNRAARLLPGAWLSYVVLGTLLVGVVTALVVATKRGFFRRLQHPVASAGVVITDEAPALKPGGVAPASGEPGVRGPLSGKRLGAATAPWSASWPRGALLDEVPGRTSGEYERVVRAVVPGAAPQFAWVTALFESCWYGREPSDADEQVLFDEAAGCGAAGRWATVSARQGLRRAPGAFAAPGWRPWPRSWPSAFSGYWPTRRRPPARPIRRLRGS